jgi:hypothetical protein
LQDTRVVHPAGIFYLVLTGAEVHAPAGIGEIAEKSVATHADPVNCQSA